jgi:hypothetical protein
VAAEGGQFVYIAQHRKGPNLKFVIRESYRYGAFWKSRDLFSLGSDPGSFLVYPGGNGFYVHEAVTDVLAEKGVFPTLDEIDDLFWPFLRPDIRRALESFRQKSSARAGRPPLGAEEERHLRQHVHLFDKRRVHFLKFGRVDQGAIGQLPISLFRWLYGKSRDEIEQGFLLSERALKPNELRTYVYVIFDLQRFFTEAIARRMPQGLDQGRVEEHFLAEICRLNQAEAFWNGEPPGGSLHDYLVRYAVMFFDFDWVPTPFLQDYLRDFMDRHRAYRPPAAPRPRVSAEDAGPLFGVAPAALRAMSRRELTRLFRQKAREHHPDAGGKAEKFIRLQEAYQSLVRRK